MTQPSARLPIGTDLGLRTGNSQNFTSLMDPASVRANINARVRALIVTHL